MNVGSRVIFHDNCKASRSHCRACTHNGQEAVIKIADRGEYVVEFPDGFSTWAGGNEVELVA